MHKQSTINPKWSIVLKKSAQEIDYFISGLGIEDARLESAEQRNIHNEYCNVFTGIGHF